MPTATELITEAGLATRLRSRTRAEQRIARTYGPKVSRYLVKLGNRLADALSAVRDDLDALAAVESVRASLAPGMGIVENVQLDAAEAPKAPKRKMSKSLIARINALIDKALDAASLDILSPTTLALADGYEAGADRQLKDMVALGLSGVGFKVVNSNSIAWVAKQSAELVTNINETTRRKMRTMITDAVAEGKSYSKLAREIRREFKDDASFSLKMPQGHIRTRAELISVTEIGNAYETGSYQTSAEFHKDYPLEKSWDNVGDRRVSDGCIENSAAGWIGFDESFPSGHSHPLRFPGCRCTHSVRRKRA